MPRRKKTATQTESLFNTGAYSSMKTGDFSHVKYDPGWDTGAAFPQPNSSNNTTLEVHNTTTPTIKDSSKKAENSNESWDSRYFGEEPPRSIDSDGQLSVFFDDSYEAPEPDDFKDIADFENAWDKWEKEELRRQASTQFLEYTTNVLISDNLENTECHDTPVKILEETDKQSLEGKTFVLADDTNQILEEKSKAPKRHRKGCLYKYLENKKLKDGTIVSYPRVIFDRDPDNVKHWRWGYNWEEKINGEWKNRSIGCPTGAVSLVIGMRNNNCTVDEIIEFIKKCKVKGEKKDKKKTKNPHT